MTRDCYELYLEEIKLLKKVFKEVRPRVFLTTDTWTSIEKINYLYLTAQFIDRNWILHKRIKNFVLFLVIRAWIWQLAVFD